MVNPRHIVRALVFASLLALFSATSVSTAYGQQQFSLTISSPLSPSAIDPGSSSVATLNLAAIGSFDSSVSFTAVPCTVTPVPTTGTAPQCAVSPGSATPPAQAFLTITTTSDTEPGLYTVSVTGTSGSSSPQTVTLTLNVVNVTEDYSLSVAPTTATPSPVTAGNISTTLVTVSPIANYSGTVTLSCVTVTPAVTYAPYCTFTATSPSSSLPAGTVNVTAGVPATATLTITTLGPSPVTRLRSGRIFYALWLLVPGLALVGMGTTGARGRTVTGTLLLLAVAAGLLLMPACGAQGNLKQIVNNSPTGGITPKNTYTFTLTGADQNGAAPSNAVSSPATVTLVVN